MAIIRMTSDAEKAKAAIAKLYNEGLVGCYHLKDGAFTHNPFRSEPNQTFDDKRQIGNGRKFEEPLNLLDAEDTYGDFDCTEIELEKEEIHCKDDVIDRPNEKPDNHKEWLDACIMDIGAPVMFVVTDNDTEDNTHR